MISKNNIINNLDIVMISIISIAVLFLITYTTGITRIICGVIFIIFIPGYSLISALFINCNILSNLQRLLLSIVSSISMISLTGLLLSLITHGVSSHWTLIFNAGLSLILLFIAVIRRNRLIPEQRFSIILMMNSFKSLLTSDENHKTARLILFLIVIVIAAGSIFTLSIVSSNSGMSDREDFYILPDNSIANYTFPRTVKLGYLVSAEVNIVNNHNEKMNYILRTLLEGQPVTADYEISLIAGEKWKSDVAFIANKWGVNQKVEYQLWISNNNKPISTLYLWLDIIK